VGTRRRILAAHAGQWYFVGPDNGLLALSLRQTKPQRIIQLTNRRYWLKPASATFEGRDIMAPAAGHLAAQGRLAALGRAVRAFTPLALPLPQRRAGTVQGCVVHIDTFGNLVTNLPASLAASGPRRAGVSLTYKRHRVRLVSSYAAGAPNELVAVVDSLGLIELAVRDGSAAWQLDGTRGDEVVLKPGAQ
jgi:S-adenosylmethionine hydrolase